ncbi:OB-fold domain-containing protein [Spongiactinospora sp. 9N601]|uniref:OB-fold domain-containing protein n=1 Tax=Spongiactinospora sp. 9N601 TaxID=3375149 RepID=UPI0037AEECD0
MSPPEPGRAAILGYGAYLPRWRVGGLPGPRCYVDEDTTTLAVEAALEAVAGRAGDLVAVYLSTTRPAYMEKTNASLLHAVLRCPEHTAAYDVNGSARSAVAAFASAVRQPRPSLVAMAGMQYGPPGGHEELHGTDAGAAFLIGPDQGGAIARIAGRASLTFELMDLWRLPDERWNRRWDARFGASVYAGPGERALTAALADAGRPRDDLATIVVAGANTKATHAVSRRLGAALPPAELGDAGAAAWGLVLIDALERAAPGDLVAVILLSDGCEVLLAERTGTPLPRRSTLRDKLARPALAADYLDYLAWRGTLPREAQRRPDPAPLSAPAAWRSARWKYGGLRPPYPGGLDLHRTRGVVSEFVVDHIAYAPQPPLISALIHFDDGQNAQLDLTDVPSAQVERGMRVEATFRRLHTSGGTHDYFWKVRPASKEDSWPSGV